MAIAEPKGMTVFEIMLDEAGRGSVLVNGEDWSDRVHAITISAKVGELTEIILHCYGKVLINESKGNLTTITSNFRAWTSDQRRQESQISD